MAKRYFSKATFDFLSSLAAHNNREWFEAHKQMYEDRVRMPALRFIEDIAADLAAISPHFRAIPKKSGGSLMRVYRDTRFGKDKRPYKTNIGIQFRHELGKDVHAPGFYLHIANDECFVGVGIWRPDATALNKIRETISESGDAWLKTINHAAFKKHFRLSGDRLRNPPRGYAKDHPLIDALKWKDYIAIASLNKNDVIGDKLLTKVVDNFKAGDSLMHFLCRALELNY